MYSVDFIERMEWITDSLESNGMLFYDVDNHEYTTREGTLDTCLFYEDLDYILGYLKDNFQKRKGLYKVSWLCEPVGIAVGSDGLKELIRDLKESIRSMEEGTYNDYKFDIKKEKQKLFSMKYYGEDEGRIIGQEDYIAHLEEDLKNFWKRLEEDFKDKDMLKIERIR